MDNYASDQREMDKATEIYDTAATASEENVIVQNPDDLIASFTQYCDTKNSSDDSESSDEENRAENVDRVDPEKVPSTKDQNINAKIHEALKNGVEKLKEGWAHETNGELKDALQLYKDGLKHLMFCRKYAKKPKAFVISLTHKCEEFLTRAEKISEKIKTMEPGTDIAYEDKSKPMSELPEFVQTDISTGITLKDVIGLTGVKDCLKEHFILPLKFPRLFSGRRPHGGILLYGAPGVGKTMISRALAAEVQEDGVTVLRVSAYDFVSRYIGDGEKMMKQVFCYANEHVPSILVMDDFEALSPRDEEQSAARRRVKTEWLIQFSNISRQTTVLGLTLSPWTIDSIFRKRFSKRVYLDLPDSAARQEMFRSLLTPPKVSADSCPQLTDGDYEEFAIKTERCTGADITVAVRDALMIPVRVLRDATYFKKVILDDREAGTEMFVPCCQEDEGAVEKNVFDIPEEELLIPRVTKEDVLAAIKQMRPSVAQEDLEKFAQFTKDFVTL